jgi:hypothetical protein
MQRLSGSVAIKNILFLLFSDLRITNKTKTASAIAETVFVRRMKTKNKKSLAA